MANGDSAMETAQSGDMRRCGFSPSSAVAGGSLNSIYFLHFCLFGFPPSPERTCVMSAVGRESLQCRSYHNGSCVKAYTSADAERVSS